MTSDQDLYAGERFVLRATVRGRVQNVGYRMFVLDSARGLRLGGFVRNQPDRSVYVEAYGARAELEHFLSLLRRGPSAARVEQVDCDWSQAGPQQGAGGFEVRA
jgi:acylphosphatase